MKENLALSSFSRERERESDELNLAEVVAVLSKYKYLIVLFVVFSLLGATVATFFTAPTYKAVSKLLLVTRSETINNSQVVNQLYEGALLNERLAKTYSQMVNRQSFQLQVAKKIKQPGNLTNLKAEPVNDTMLIAVAAEAKDPRLAAQAANVAGKLIIAEVKKINEGVQGQTPPIELKLVEPAFTPDKPVKPKLWLNLLLALFLSLPVSLILAFGLESLQQVIKSEEDLVQLLPEKPLLGEVPKVENNSTQRIVVKSEKPHMAKVAFQIVALNLENMLENEGFKVNEGKLIALTSPGGKEGKTFITANLGTAFALAEKKVLLIEADLINPSLTKTVSTVKTKGLLNLYLGQVDVEECYQRTYIKNLYLVTAGQSGQSVVSAYQSGRIWRSESFGQLLTKAKMDFDYVLIDLPPVLMVPESLAAAQKADGVILTAMVNKTDKKACQKLINEFSQLHISVLGAIVNGVAPTMVPYYASYYYGTYKKAAKG
jgi:capsular exopolysaccharide synthesis family protein